ncbi:hypothetical protein BaRGS_00008907 [Batillaria attramentaria]|uniref:Uncharacterized protein n=1 Tax=Batillaria attramentaria TaxID=370345 RepID=A0ABD0LKR7_9CAEN
MCTRSIYRGRKEKRKKWLKGGSAAHNALKTVVLDKRLVYDIRNLSQFLQTGAIEVYHSLMTKYVAKRQAFDPKVMEARTCLAAIDHNSSLGREQTEMSLKNRGEDV